MLNERESNLLLNQLLHNEQFIHQSKMALIYNEEALMIIQRLGAKIFKDGNQYCCLYGDTIQDGICGFGDSPMLAAIEFRKEFFNEK